MRDQIRHQFRELGLGNQERSQPEQMLCHSKPVLLLKVPEYHTLSVKIARLAKDNDQLSAEIASLKQILVNLQQSKVTRGLELQAMDEEIDRLRRGRVCMPLAPEFHGSPGCPIRFRLDISEAVCISTLML
jgi:ribosomal protein L29